MRSISIFICLLMLAGSVFAQQQTLKKEIESFLKDKKATVGVAVLSSDNKILTVNGQKHYPLMSVFKFHLALAVLDHLEKNQLPLETKIHVDKSDLLPDTYSPLRDAYPQGNFDMTVSELLEYTVARSDNNTCDLLLKYMGGPRVVEQYIKRLGIKDLAIAVTEDDMHKKFEKQYLNWSTPAAAVELLRIFIEKTPLSGVYKEYLETTMIRTETGTDKLKAGLPVDAVLGHKTGNSARSQQGLKVADNDLGFVRLPDGRQYYIAVFIMDSMEDDRTNAAVIAGISKIVYDYQSRK